MPDVRLRTVPFDHPDATALIAELQQEYVRRYGGQDVTPVDISEFAAPRGLFLVGYLHGEPVACGGWRAHDGDEPGFAAGDAEIKRMYVAPSAQRRGLGRRMLAHVEATAGAAGVEALVLETGEKQPEAIALYTRAGYEPIPTYGVYRDWPSSRCYAKPLRVLR